MRFVKLSFLLICRSLGLFRLACWVTGRRLRILCYHGFSVMGESAFRPKMFMTGERFERRLEILRAYGMPVIPLDQAVRGLYERSLPRLTTVITVDDGFHSFHKVALPRLRRYEVPATVYVTTYYVCKGTPVFRLVVQYMFWKAKKRSVDLSGFSFTRRQVIDFTNVRERDDAMWELIDHGERRCDEAARIQLCEQLGLLLGVSYEEIVASRAMHLMTPEELSGLASKDIAVGLHTHRHTFPEGDRAAAEKEINENREELGRLIGEVAQHFCYPSGIWCEHEWAWLDQLGIESSTTCIPGLNSPSTPRHALRRFLDGDDVHELEFEAAITGFSELLSKALPVAALC